MASIDTIEGQINQIESRKSSRCTFGWLLAALKDIRDGQRALYGNHGASGYDEAFETPSDRVLLRDGQRALYRNRGASSHDEAFEAPYDRVLKSAALTAPYQNR